MRAVLLEVPESMLAERRRLGLDGRDEVWDSVLHMVPDQLYCRPEHQSDRGAERAELVVEIRSKDDETYEKIGFYAALGVQEMLIVHPEGRRVELLRAVGGQLLPVSADAQGALRSDVLATQFATADGTLRITWQDGTAEI
ncbi:MAG TPA: Uma2 family endonuclease [Pseudonocardiaceae bacterium]|nr:Uma2 family endonuclease [Pseudonocardiaceae bacterium]